MCKQASELGYTKISLLMDRILRLYFDRRPVYISLGLFTDGYASRHCIEPNNTWYRI